MRTKIYPKIEPPNQENCSLLHLYITILKSQEGQLTPLTPQLRRPCSGQTENSDQIIKTREVKIESSWCERLENTLDEQDIPNQQNFTLKIDSWWNYFERITLVSIAISFMLEARVPWHLVGTNEASLRPKVFPASAEAFQSRNFYIWEIYFSKEILSFYREQEQFCYHCNWNLQNERKIF